MVRHCDQRLAEITQKIDEMKLRSGKTWTLKQMEIFKRNLQDRFDRLYNAANHASNMSSPLRFNSEGCRVFCMTYSSDMELETGVCRW